MKALLLSFVSILSLTLVVGCGNSENHRFTPDQPVGSEKPSDVLARAAGAGHIKYFGYYGSGNWWVSGGNFIPEISDHANVAWIAHCGEETAKLEQAKARRMFAMVDINCYFLNDSFNLVPKSQYEPRWQDFVNRVRPYQDVIVAFYNLDEPFLNGKNRGIPLGTMAANLNTINNVVKASFPTKPRAVIFSATEMYYDGFHVPSTFDWVGFDCYGAWEKCLKDRSIPELFSHLASRISGSQKLFLVPDGNFKGYPNAGEQANIATRVYQYFDLAQRDGRVIGIFPFIYQSFNDGNGHYTGVRDMPGALPSYKAIGRTISSAVRSGCQSLNFISGGVSSRSVPVGGTFMVRCDYGKANNSTVPVAPGTKCVGVAINGTTAEFKCTAPSSAATIDVACRVLANTADNLCAQTNSLGKVAVGGEAPPIQPSSKPDLVITELSTNPAIPRDGDQVSFTVKIKNQGLAPVPKGKKIKTAILIDGKRRASVELSLAEDLAINGIQTVSTSQDRAWKAEGGTIRLEAVVDDSKRISESDEKNNLLSRLIVIEVTNATPPVATVTDLSGALNSRTFGVRMQVNAEDVGKNGAIYIAALVPGTPSNTLYYLNSKGRFIKDVTGKAPPAFKRGKLPATFEKLLQQNADLTAYQGTTVYIGYGFGSKSHAEMRKKNRYTNFYTVQP